jgi:tryptophanyl-tRNA synthetase
MDFGSKEYKDELCEFSRNYMLRSDTGIIRGHRDLEVFLQHYRTYGRDKCYIYTGRGPSTKGMHLGHLLPFMLTKVLQRELGVRVVILLTDDEKFLYRREHPLETYTEFAQTCKSEIMSLGLIPELTDIYIGTESIERFYPTILRIQDRINFNQISSVFGLQEHDSIGKIGFPAYEMALCDPRTLFKAEAEAEAEVKVKVEVEAEDGGMRCLVLCAQDQDPFFRLIRDHSRALGFAKPSLLFLEYLPGLDGSAKMNSTAEGGDVAAHRNTVIFLSDTRETVSTKIRKYAFSGGAATKREHTLHGANVDIDISCKYLKFFMPDRQRFAEVIQAYSSGTMFTSDVKELCAKVVSDMLEIK